MVVPAPPSVGKPRIDSQVAQSWPGHVHCCRDWQARSNNAVKSRLTSFSTKFQGGRLATLIEREQVQLMRRAEPTAAGILGIRAISGDVS